MFVGTTADAMTDMQNKGAPSVAHQRQFGHEAQAPGRVLLNMSSNQCRVVGMQAVKNLQRPLQSSLLLGAKTGAALVEYEYSTSQHIFQAQCCGAATKIIFFTVTGPEHDFIEQSCTCQTVASDIHAEPHACGQFDRSVGQRCESLVHLTDAAARG